MARTDRYVPEWVRVTAWCLMLLLWTAGALKLATGVDGYERISGLLIGLGSAAAFLPLIRSTAPSSWVSGFAVASALFQVADHTEMALSGPLWWYAAALSLGVLPLVRRVRTRAAFLAHASAILALAACSLLPGVWSRASGDAFGLFLTLLLVPVIPIGLGNLLHDRPGRTGAEPAGAV
jgi:hypothetical protein